MPIMDEKTRTVMEAVRRKVAAEGLSIAAVAKRTKTTRTSLSRYFHGHTVPKLDTFLELIGALGMDLIELGQIVRWLEEGGGGRVDTRRGRANRGMSEIREGDALYNALELLVERILDRRDPET